MGSLAVVAGDAFVSQRLSGHLFQTVGPIDVIHASDNSSVLWLDQIIQTTIIIFSYI